jgi:hypothetical protein
MASPQINRRRRRLAARKNQPFSSVVMEGVYRFVLSRAPRHFHRGQSIVLAQRSKREKLVSPLESDRADRFTGSLRR